MYPGINSLGAFREHSYASICSLNVPGESEMYTVSGLDTEQTPATIEWKTVAENYTDTDITTAGMFLGLSHSNICFIPCMCLHSDIFVWFEV